MNRFGFFWKQFSMYLDEEKLIYARKKPVVIWGAGQVGRSLYNILQSLGMPVNCFIDSDIHKHGKIIDNIFCKETECILAIHSNLLIILTQSHVAAGLREIENDKGHYVITFVEYFMDLLSKKDFSVLEIGPLNALFL